VERLISFMSWWRSLPVVLALAFSGCEKKADPIASVTLFFQQVAAGQAKTAWQSAAFGFQAQRSAEVFETAAKEMGITEYTAGEWEKPEFTANTAKVRGRIKTRSGKELPLIVTLTDELGAWRVYSLRPPPSEQTGVSENRFTLIGKAPAFTNAVPQPVPPEMELRQLVRENLLRFNDAIAAKSFDAFYDSVSVKWQDQLTKGQLQREFQPFIDKKITIAGIEKVEPIWDAPITVGTDGLLTLSGYFPTQPYRVNFALKFLYELPAWKLFGLDVNLQK
jgi:hypothetical protein